MALTHQLAVLAALDRVKTQRHHLTAFAVAGTGFATGAYDLFSVSLVSMLLGRVYYTDPSKNGPGELPANVSAALQGVALCGTLAGQIFFGWLGDRLGRLRVYGFALVLMVVCSAASGLSFGRTAKGVMATLCFFRFWLCFGVGGGYPLSATIMSEYASKRMRGAFVAAVHAMQGFGILFAAAVALAISAALRKAHPGPAYDAADYLWRIILMFGAVPAALAYYWCSRLPETARYTALVARDPMRATADMSKLLLTEIVEQDAHAGDEWGLFSAQFLRRHGLHLLATSSAWFLLDVTFYSQNLLQKDLFRKSGWFPPASAMDAIEEVIVIARAQAVTALCGAIPGYLCTVAFIEILGRFRIQLVGFLMMTLFVLGLALPYDHWTSAESSHRAGFAVLYNLTFFFANFGPNSTSFVLPAELFPARLRCTCHGLSAAAGRAGVVLGAFGFYPKKSGDSEYPAGIGTRNELFVLAGTNFLGMLMTLFLPETKGVSLEVISKEVVYDV